MYNQNESLMNHENFLLPAMVENDFTPEELAEDMEGIQMSFQRVKIPSGGMLQFELPSDDPDNPDYAKIWRASSFTIIPIMLTGLKEMSMMTIIQRPSVLPLMEKWDWRTRRPLRCLCTQPVWYSSRRERKSLQKYADSLPAP